MAGELHCGYDGLENSDSLKERISPLRGPDNSLNPNTGGTDEQIFLLSEPNQYNPFLLFFKAVEYEVNTP
jgi:hypothetical protein